MKRIHRWLLLTISLVFTLLIGLFSACEKPSPEIYTVTVLPATGGVVTVDKIEVEEGGNVTISVEAYSQYGLSSLSVNGQNAETVDGTYTVQNVQTDLLISAVFIKQSCSVSFVVDEDVEWVETEPQDFMITLGMPYGDLPTVTALSKTGYEFIGWFTSEEDGKLVTSQTVVEELHQTLYARWNPMTGIQVSFNAGIGGNWLESAPENLDLTYGEAYGELPNGDVVFRENYMLSGWYTAATAAPASFTPSSTLASPPTWCPPPRDWAAVCPWVPPSWERRWRTSSLPGITAPPLAAIPWPARGPSISFRAWMIGC